MHGWCEGKKHELDGNSETHRSRSLRLNIIYIQNSVHDGAHMQLVQDYCLKRKAQTMRTIDEKRTEQSSERLTLQTPQSVTPPSSAARQHIQVVLSSLQ
jgi:hypothetical protein